MIWLSDKSIPWGDVGWQQTLVLIRLAADLKIWDCYSWVSFLRLCIEEWVTRFSALPSFMNVVGFIVLLTLEEWVMSSPALVVDERFASRFLPLATASWYQLQTGKTGADHLLRMVHFALIGRELLHLLEGSGHLDDHCLYIWSYMSNPSSPNITVFIVRLSNKIQTVFIWPGETSNSTFSYKGLFTETTSRYFFLNVFTYLL